MIKYILISLVLLSQIMGREYVEISTFTGMKEGIDVHYKMVTYYIKKKSKKGGKSLQVTKRERYKRFDKNTSNLKLGDEIKLTDDIWYLSYVHEYTRDVNQLFVDNIPMSGVYDVSLVTYKKEYDFYGNLIMDIKLEWDNDNQKYIEVVQRFKYTYGNLNGEVVETYKNEFHPKDLHKWRIVDMESEEYVEWLTEGDYLK